MIVAAHEIAVDWANLLRIIPGYDPIETAADGDWFDPDIAQSAIDFIETYLTFSRGSSAGKPFHLERWQAAIVANLYGWQRKDDVGETVRRYRESFVGIPRKNGKTELVAGLGLLALFWEREMGTEVYCGAKDRSQASKLLATAKLMVRRSRELTKISDVFQHSIMRKPDDGSLFRAVSKDAGKIHGENPAFIAIDEVHVQPNGELIEALTTGIGARLQPLTVYISTSDYDRPHEESICNTLWDYARAVRDREADNSRYLPVLYEADDKADDWTDEAVWSRVNPNLGVSVRPEYLRDMAAKAKHLPRLVNSFKRLHLNIRTGQVTQWLPMDFWDECSGGIDVEGLRDQLEGVPCWAALDMSQKYDLTAFVLVAKHREESGDVYTVSPWFWLPEDQIRNPKREREKRDLYQRWHSLGLLEAIPGETVDPARVRDRIEQLAETYSFRQIGFDPWGAEDTMRFFDDRGFDVVKFRPSYRDFNGGSKELEAAVTSRRLVHGGHEILREQARVCAVDEDHNEEIRPSKKRSGDKIDGIVATVMALSLAMTGSEEDEVFDGEFLAV